MLPAAFSLQDLGIIVGIIAGLATAAVAAVTLIDRRRAPVPSTPDADRRALAQDCAVTLTRTAVILDNIRMYLWGYSESLPEIEGFSIAYSNLEEIGGRLDELRGLVSVEYGDGPTKAAFEQAVSAVLEIYRALGRIRREYDTPPESDSARRQVRDYFEEDRQKTLDERKRFDTAHAAFAQAAAAGRL
jgi:hypothetical protein